MEQPRYAGLTHGLDNDAGQFNVCSLEAAFAGFIEDANQIDYYIGIAQQGSKTVMVVRVGIDQPHSGVYTERTMSCRPPARYGDAVAQVSQPENQVRANKARAAEYTNTQCFHVMPLVLWIK